MGSITERLRTTFSRLVLEWGTSHRYLVSVPVRFRIVVCGRERRVSRSIAGATYDISETGIGLLTNTVSADGLHVYFSNDMISKTLLEIEIQAPEGQIAMVGQTTRYLKFDGSNYSYLLGVKVVGMSTSDRSRFGLLLATSSKRSA